MKTVDTYIVKRLVLYRNNANLSCFKHSIALVDLEEIWGLGVCVKKGGGLIGLKTPLLGKFQDRYI